GGNWERIDTGYIGHLYGAAFTKNSAGEPTILAYGFGGNVFRLGAGADKWWQIKSPTDKSIIAAVKAGDGLVMVDQNSRLLETNEDSTALMLKTTTEGTSVTGMTLVDGQLIISAEGGPRILALPQ
ncbi:MAG: hypothetical protein R3194_14370, partial [Limnobacter sp.]|nr:hypothetical protein [Limnobacter sp.]